MGHSTAADLNEYAPTKRIAVHAHFQSNCFPPVPDVCVEPALAAIDACERGEYDEQVALPDGVEHSSFGSLVSAAVAVEAWHLDAFVSYPEEAYE